MDAEQIRELEPKLQAYLKEFDDCFVVESTRGHLPVYIGGQLSDLPRKSVEPIALQAGMAPRTLQEFLSLLKWDVDLMRDRLQQRVARQHAGPHSIAIFDETSCVKKGTKTPGVQRQYCGSTGKIENCVVTVHLAFAQEDFHCLLGSALYLPESWSDDRERCRAAGIADEIVYRAKWKIALELLDESLRNGLEFSWTTFDEGYGSKPPFLRGLAQRKQRYVGEIPVNFRVWVAPAPSAGKRRKRRVLPRRRPAIEVGHLLRFSPAVRDQEWTTYRVKEGTQGPMLWRVKHLLVYFKDEQKNPRGPYHLVIASNALNPSEVKYFVSNAEPGTPVQQLLLVGFSRWRVERCFEDEKTELGFDHFEGRQSIGLKRHQAITATTHLFLAEVHQELRKKKSGAYRVPSQDRRRGAGSVVVERQEPDRPRRQEDPIRSSQPRGGTKEPYQTDTTAPQKYRDPPRRRRTLCLGLELGS